MVICPECGFADVTRIGFYEYRCDFCGEVFDCNESKDLDDNWYPNEDDEDEF